MITRFLLVLAMANAASAAPLIEHAATYRRDLTQKILPYWLSLVDTNNGGYLPSDDAVRGRSTPREKTLVSQARMVWTFAHAHENGFEDSRGSLLAAARNGYQFLTEKFRDPEHGGYYWKTDLAGNVTNPRKIIYGESFVIYAFVEYYRASKDPEALRRAMELYQLIQRHSHDEKNRGWTEHFTREWKPLAPRDPAGEVEVSGLKSANTHLHLMEALTELYEVTKDLSVQRSLLEAVDLNMRYFYPREPGKSCFHREPDWREVMDPRSAGLSYGHNVEFAWLMVRGQQALGQIPAWPHFYTHMLHALRFGHDAQRGGLYNRGVGNEPATDRNKVWWVQAEWIAALAVALQHERNGDLMLALDKAVHFVNEHMADKKDSVWIDTVTEEGKPKSTGKAHGWKANYHDVRALVKFINAFERPPERTRPVLPARPRPQPLED